MRQLLPIASKVSAVAVTALGVLALHGLLVTPVTNRLAMLSERIEDQRRLLGRYEQLLEAAAAPSGEAPALTSVNFTILPGHNEQIKAASLQARVTKAAEDAGIRLASLASVPGRSEDEVRVVGVDVQFQADLKSLGALLSSLEADAPTILVDALQISQAPDASVRPGRELDVRLTALGLVGRVGAP
ncbi:MAG: type II secretion system protein GspM [Hyphomicrobium sp.]|uniref:type II secretion system protein GspM n=1 Tax=Hyphomicrobium sp. TaxID=82 RepID=UPI003D10CB96